MNKRILVLVAVVTSFGPFSMDLYLPALPELRDEMGAGAAAVQLTVTACILGLGLGQLLAGLVPESRGRKPVLLVGCPAGSSPHWPAPPRPPSRC
ncbi:hypothetical protein [Nocardioides bruguierae]|uniref:MFS transporter n=1 Tax=Nocardioides bruguierae TaxID=2945102 RepID=A0A9X2D3V2_9ACTN|nr:hypothetical protein [Nocardioides bruguierae]MCM0618851.1 hypothetical protein [Nocardioides bruguierae]